MFNLKDFRDTLRKQIKTSQRQTTNKGDLFKEGIEGLRETINTSMSSSIAKREQTRKQSVNTESPANINSFADANQVRIPNFVSSIDRSKSASKTTGQLTSSNRNINKFINVTNADLSMSLRAKDNFGRWKSQFGVEERVPASRLEKQSPLLLKNFDLNRRNSSLIRPIRPIRPNDESFNALHQTLSKFNDANSFTRPNSIFAKIKNAREQLLDDREVNDSATVRKYPIEVIRDMIRSFNGTSVDEVRRMSDEYTDELVELSAVLIRKVKFK
jgi:hypothetical protein